MDIKEIVLGIIQYDLPIEEKKGQIEGLNERYYKATGEFIPSWLLNILGDWLLEDTLKNRAGNKVSVEEYPVLSKHQLQRRERKTLLIEKEEVLDYIKHVRDNNLSRRNSTKGDNINQ